ncbi:THUMP-like domain-containing protein [Georgenia sp. Z1491]|uniref:class I SAM-dependent methyltransferase n=1 Tax=Georgenia sp. Z1491 TaxID=3416707 RepID=UPI003CEAC3A5
MELDTARTLASTEGRAMLAALPPYSPATAEHMNARLRAHGMAPDLASAALTQLALRAEAADRLGPVADLLLLTRAGLEQATRTVVAAHHAHRFRRASVTRVADLGCGLGLDSLAIAGLGTGVVAVEQDPVTAAFARANLEPFDGAEVREADALDVDLTDLGADALWADPARRDAAGRRLTEPESWSPPLADVVARARSVRAAGIKVAPGIELDRIPDDAHAQWVSVDREVVEAALWFGDAAPEGAGRSALVLLGEEPHLLAPEGGGPLPPSAPHDDAPVAPLGAFLHEPDGAVIRAGLVADLARLLGAGVVSPRIAYLTSDAPAASPFARSYRILEQVDAGAKGLARAVAAREIGDLTIKQRGSGVKVEDVRRRLRLRGPNRATLVLTRAEGRHVALLVEPVPETSVEPVDATSVEPTHEHGDKG